MATGQPCRWTMFSQPLPKHLQVRSRVSRQTRQRGAFSLTWSGVWAIGGTAIVILATTTGSQAQQVVPLPPPPTVSVPSLSPASSFANPNPAPGRETVFVAPVNPQTSSSNRYIVYVNGDSPYLLQQVRTIEPNASIQQYQGQSVIQAGTFDSETQARQQIAALNAQGILAEMATTMGISMTTAPTNVAAVSHYLVIIPGSREELPALADRAVRMGIRQEAIQQKDMPLGPHLEIGPFTDNQDASKISQFLNGGGLDSQVYYKR